MKLSELGEFGFIERMKSWLPASQATVGIGDDAAVATVGDRTIVATTDALVEGIHFRLDWSTAADIGFKAVSVNVSDVAAMGAEPRWLLLTLCAPESVDDSFLESLYGGVAEACALYGAELIGGDTVRSRDLVLAVTAIGELDGEPLLRSGAKSSDVVAVTGELGRAVAGLNLLTSQEGKGVTPEDAMACIDAHRRPVARVGEGRRLRERVHAAIDLSDGLASDVRRIAEASGVGIEIDIDRLPIAPEVRRIAEIRGWDAGRMALAGGEDLELLVTASDVTGLGLTEIGRVVDDGVWAVRNGVRAPLEVTGFDHFRIKP